MVPRAGRGGLEAVARAEHVPSTATIVVMSLSASAITEIYVIFWNILIYKTYSKTPKKRQKVPVLTERANPVFKIRPIKKQGRYFFCPCWLRVGNANRNSPVCSWNKTLWEIIISPGDNYPWQKTQTFPSRPKTIAKGRQKNPSRFFRVLRCRCSRPKARGDEF